MRANTGFVCHTHTSMVSYEDHHVWPLGYHGPDTKANKIRICPNAHSDIHFLMERWLRGKPVDLREYGESVRHYAKAGYDQVIGYSEKLAAIYEDHISYAEELAATYAERP